MCVCVSIEILIKIFLLFFLDFPEKRFTKTNFSYRDSFQLGTQLLMKQHSFNLIVVLRTYGATVCNWILSLLPEKPNVLSFIFSEQFGKMK